ncbi:MAG: hypothetical protein AB1716_16890 [Planctomycetota bacterium]
MNDSEAPLGGLRAGPHTLRAWQWDARGEVTRPVRCKRESWYIVRARLPAGAANGRGVPLRIGFAAADGRAVGRRGVMLQPRPALDGEHVELLAWIRTPGDATHLCVERHDAHDGLSELTLHEVAERDPKCHPLANVPRWASYRTPFTIERILLPPALAGIAGWLDGGRVEVLPERPGAAELAREARGAAVVIDPAWVGDRGLGLREIEAIAAASWVLIDLETLARLANEAGVAAEVRTYTSRHGLMSARVVYADVPTRGFALQDVFPYSTVGPGSTAGRGGVAGTGRRRTRDLPYAFRMRVLRNSRVWRAYADGAGMATLVSGETPWADRNGDVLSAMRAVGGGELIATDLPWLATGAVAGNRATEKGVGGGGSGLPIAPGLVRHLLRMHVGLPLAEHVQYWNRLADEALVVRDIGDMPGRCPPLQTARWAADEAGVAHLGLTLGGQGPARRHVLVQTGPIDTPDGDSLPAEPMVIFMKGLAREMRERTAWAQRWLADVRVTWQFDTGLGLRHVMSYDAAPTAGGEEVRMVRVRLGEGEANAAEQLRAGAREVRLALDADEGLYGDWSLDFQARLTTVLRAALGSH